MYRIAICDDEPAMLGGLRELAGRVLDELEIEYEIVAFTGPEQLLPVIAGESGLFHVLILDIQMDGMNGIELAQRLRKGGCRAGIIFATSHREFALEGYSVQPIQYLLKPVEFGALRDALRLDFEQNYKSRNLLVETKDGMQAVSIRDILYIEVMGRMVTIHAVSGDTVFPAKLKDIADRLAGDDFVRCHKSYVVSLRKAKSLKRYEFVLKENATVPIGKNYYTDVQRAFISFHNR